MNILSKASQIYNIYYFYTGPRFANYCNNNHYCPALSFCIASVAGGASAVDAKYILKNSEKFLRFSNHKLTQAISSLLKCYRQFGA